MDVRADLTAGCSRDRLLIWVEDLERYPRWMRLTHRVERLPDDPLGAAWSVELRAQVGRLARSKRLRMVRVAHDESCVVFERHEADGRRHSPWVLTVTLSEPPADEGQASTDPVTHLAMHLHYGGRLWTGGVLERILTDEIERGRDALVALATGNAGQ